MNQSSKNKIQLYWAYWGDDIVLGISGKCGKCKKPCRCEVAEIKELSNILYNFGATNNDSIELGPNFHYIRTSFSQLKKALQAIFINKKSFLVHTLSRKDRKKILENVIQEAEVFANSVIEDIVFSKFLQNYNTASVNSFAIEKSRSEHEDFIFS